MTDDEADDGSSKPEPRSDRNKHNPRRATGLGPAWPADLFAKLDVLSSVQRNLAATNYSALSAAQRSIDASQLTKIAGFAPAQDSIARKFAGAVDFSWLGERWLRPAGVDRISGLSDASHVWGSALKDAVNISALDDAVRASGGLVKLQGLEGFFSERFRLQSEALARIAESPIFDLPQLDLSKYRNAFLRWIPTNLHEVDDLDASRRWRWSMVFPSAGSLGRRSFSSSSPATRPPSDVRCWIVDGRRSWWTARRRWTMLTTSGRRSAGSP